LENKGFLPGDEKVPELGVLAGKVVPDLQKSRRQCSRLSIRGRAGLILVPKETNTKSKRKGRKGRRKRHHRTGRRRKGNLAHSNAF